MTQEEFDDLKRRGLFDVVDFINTELKDLLEEEGRYFKKVETYYQEIWENLHPEDLKNLSEEDLDAFGKILWIIRKRLLIDYQRLQRRGLGRADSAILLMKRLIDSLCEKDYRYIEESKRIKEILDILFDNIRNKVKFDNLREFKDEIDRLLSPGTTKLRGICVDQFSLDTDPQIFGRKTFKNSENIVDPKQGGKITSISL